MMGSFLFLKDKFSILQVPCFKIVSDEIVWLRLFFRQMLLDSVVAPPRLYNGSIGAQELNNM